MAVYEAKGEFRAWCLAVALYEYSCVPEMISLNLVMTSVIFVSSFRQILGSYLDQVMATFTPYPFQLTAHQSGC